MNFKGLFFTFIAVAIGFTSYSQYYSNESKDKFVKELFSKYSPNSNYIIDNLGDFNYLYYLKGKTTEAEILSSLEVLVHESSHALSAIDLVSKFEMYNTNPNVKYSQKLTPINSHFRKAVRQQQSGDIIKYSNIYIADSLSIFMSQKRLFCESDINEIVPEKIRNEIFRIAYTQNCNRRGLFSYVNEFSAYYTGSKAVIDLCNYIIGKARVTKDPKYLLNIKTTLSSLDAYYEMKLFIAWHLLYAKKNNPDDYETMISNDNLRVTFTLIDQLFSKLVDNSQSIISEMEDILKNEFEDKIQIKEKEILIQKSAFIYYVYDLNNTKTDFLKKQFSTEVIDELEKFKIPNCNLTNYQMFLEDPISLILSQKKDSINIKRINISFGPKSNSKPGDSIINLGVDNSIKPVVFKDYPSLSDFNKTPLQKRYFETLEKYSPECYGMLTDYYTLPRKVVCPEIEWTLEAPINIETLINKKDFLGSVPWAMFNLCHKYTTIKGNVFAASERKCDGMKEGLYTYSINPQKAITVNHTDVILTRKIANKVPEGLRGQYFQSTMASSDKELATQKYGIYGLLDEYNSFYYAMRVTLDLLDVYKNEYGTNTQKWLQFFGRSEMIYSIYSEYKMYILEYLKAVKIENPEIYAGIIGNEEFKQAFFEIDKNWIIAMREYDQFKDQSFGYLRTNKLIVTEDQMAIKIGNMAIPTKRSYVSQVDKYLNSNTFLSIIDDLDYRKNSITY